jgi:FkbM family methyltransferase
MGNAGMIRGLISRARNAFRQALGRAAPAGVGNVPKEYIARFLPAGPVVVEAGGFDGTDTLEMSRLWPAGRFHVFEPVPALYARLQKNTARRSNVRPYPLAVGDRCGTMKMFVSSGSSDASSSLLPPGTHVVDHPETKFDSQVEVPVTTIDAWANKHGVTRVDLFWLDLQGFELPALKGAESILATASAVYSEVFLEEYYRGATQYADLKGWLISRGFRVEREELPWHCGGNVLFVRASGRHAEASVAGRVPAPV